MKKATISVISLAAVNILLAGVLFAEQAESLQPSVILPAPTTTYTLASPRMSIIRAPRYQIASDGTRVEVAGTPYGAAENFARKGGEIKIATGVRVVFCLSRALEGVWYDQTYGRLSTSMVLQKFVPTNSTATEGTWVEIGADKAAEVRKGPSITRAKVGVPLVFKEPGVYLLRALIRTEAQPLEPMLTVVWPGAVDTDIVEVKVKVVNKPIVEIIPDVEPSPDPDFENIRPLLKQMDAEEEFLSADINGDDIVDYSDLMTLSQQWCREKEVPLTSID